MCILSVVMKCFEEYDMEGLMRTKIPPPPMPRVKPAKEANLDGIGYTAEQMRAFTVPKMEYIYGQLMQQMKAIAEEGRCALITDEFGFNREDLDSMRQKIVDKMKADKYEVYFARNNSSRGPITRWVFKW